MQSQRKPITARQKRVIELVRAGCANKEIAALLGITEAGVKKHLEALFRRYSVSSRLALVMAAVDAGDVGPLGQRALNRKSKS